MEVVVEVMRLRQLTHWVSAGPLRSLSALPLHITQVCALLKRDALDHRLINPFFSSEILGIPDEKMLPTIVVGLTCAQGPHQDSHEHPIMIPLQLG